ncbi:MAG: hypothetical protein H8E38_13895 [SAR324 cluster bacterium]|nr:hypothetical protein [SAR324 cluster bacterium]MBL7035645.1 hypothetical protein [SAR324 cluster bacterium]
MNLKTSNIRELPDIQKPLLLFKHLSADLDLLKSQFRNLEKNQLSSKLLSGLSIKRGDIPSGKELEFTGRRLSLKLKNKKAHEISEQLLKQPKDSKSRVELVELFLQESENSSLETARDAFLLAMLEVENPSLSIQKINAGLASQSIYLNKLYNYLNDELVETESKIKGDGNVDIILEKQQKRLQFEVGFINSCLKLLESEALESEYELNLIKSRTENKIPFGDLKNGFDPMLRRMVFLPLAKDNLDLMFDILHRLESKNPFVGYHQSKMYDVLAQIDLNTASSGDVPESKKSGFDYLSKALSSIGDAISLIGDVPEKLIEKAAIYRYGHLCNTIHQSFKNHDIPVPTEHHQRMHKAISLLEPIAIEPKMQKLQAKLLLKLEKGDG